MVKGLVVHTTACMFMTLTFYNQKQCIIYWKYTGTPVQKASSHINPNYYKMVTNALAISGWLTILI